MMNMYKNWPDNIINYWIFNRYDVSRHSVNENLVPTIILSIHKIHPLNILDCLLKNWYRAFFFKNEYRETLPMHFKHQYILFNFNRY